ncbi:MAG: aminotransferase class I/II-fold pyridoxal phosphate-dependent enzyme [Pirellula sp.]
MLTPEDFWDSLGSDLQDRKQKGLLRSLVPSAALGPTQVLRHGKRLLHFASNDYLALAWNPEIRKQYNQIAPSIPTGSGSSPLILGSSEQYLRLVKTIAMWQESQSAVVFPSGYAANLGTLSALATPDDLILSDSLNHACLIDGCRLSKATVKIYPHADTNALRDILATHRSGFRMAFIVTDTVFSMDGDIAPIQQIESLCREFDAIGLADEAHASGVLGRQGRGALELAQADRSLWIKTGTLSKAIGCVGGYVVGSDLLCQTLIHRARSLIYSTALPPSILGAANCAIEILQQMDYQRQTLLQMSQSLREQLTHHGFRTSDARTPIVPIYMAGPHEAIALSNRLLESGIYVPAIRPPTVPSNGCLLRVSLNAAHTIEDCQRLVDQLRPKQYRYS